MEEQKTPLIFQKIANIMRDVEHVGKGQKNQQQGYKFRGIDDMYNSLHADFAKHEVFITSEVISQKREERKTERGGTLFYVILEIRFTFYAIDGSNVSSVMVGEAMDSGDKASNKAMSIALKYALMQILLLPTEELKNIDPDGHSPQPIPKEDQLLADLEMLFAVKLQYLTDKERSDMEALIKRKESVRYEKAINFLKSK